MQTYRHSMHFGDDACMPGTMSACKSLIHAKYLHRWSWGSIHAHMHLQALWHDSIMLHATNRKPKKSCGFWILFFYLVDEGKKHRDIVSFLVKPNDNLPLVLIKTFFVYFVWIMLHFCWWHIYRNKFLSIFTWQFSYFGHETLTVFTEYCN